MSRKCHFQNPEGKWKVSLWDKGQQSGRTGAELRGGQGQAGKGSWPTAHGREEPGGGFMLNAELCKEGSAEKKTQVQEMLTSRVPLAVCLL